MKKTTKKDYEEYLNELYTPEKAWEIACYMYKRNMRYVMRYGTVLRKKDPIAFEVGYREYCLSN